MPELADSSVVKEWWANPAVVGMALFHNIASESSGTALMDGNRLSWPSAEATVGTKATPNDAVTLGVGPVSAHRMQVLADG